MKFFGALLGDSSLKVKSIFLFFGRIFGFLINFSVPIILVRIITKYDFGLYQQFNLMYSTLVIVFSMWINSAVYYFFPNNNKKNQSYYLYLIILIECFIWLILSSFYFLYEKEFLEYFSITQDLGNFNFGIIITIFFLFISSILDYLFIVHDKKILNLLFFPIDRLIKAILIIGFVYNYSLKGIIVAFLIYSFLRFCYTLVYFKRNFYNLRLSSIFSGDAKIFELLKYSLPFGVGLVSQNISLKIDQFFLIEIVNADQFAVYSLAFYGVPIVNLVLSSINNIAMPEFTQFAKNKEYENMVILWSNIMKKTYSVILPALGFFFFFAPEIIIVLFTSEYEDSTLFYRIYLFTLLFTATSYGLILRATNNTKFVMISNVTGLIISLILGIYLIPEYKLNGAITVALLAFIIPVFLQLMFEIRFLNSTIVRVIPFRIIGTHTLITLVSIFVAVIIGRYFSMELLRLIFAGIIFSTVVIFLQHRFKVFFFQNELNRVLKKVKIINND